VEEKAKETASEFGIQSVYTDFEDAIESENPIHVSAIMPPDARIPVVPDILTYEPASLVIEKPVANTLTDVQRIVDAATVVDTRVVVCHQKVFSDELQALESWIDENRLGDVTRLVGSTKLGIAGQGTHFVHAMNWLLDDTPERVHGWAHGPKGLNPEPGGHAQPSNTLYELTYPDDTRAFVHQGETAPDIPEQASKPHLEYKLDVVGSNGRAEYILGHHAKGVFVDGQERIEARPFDENAYMTRELYAHLSAVLTGESDDHPSDLASAVTAHRTLDSALRSAIEGRPIDVEENPPMIGATTNERLRRQLSGRKPICVSSLLYGNRPRKEVLDSLSSLGAHHVDLWGTAAFVDYHANPETESIEDLKTDLNDHAIQTPVISVYDDEPVIPKLEYAAALGADTVVMAGRSPERPETWDQNQLIEWLDKAHNYGLRLAFENHIDTLETIAEMEALLDALDHSAASICLAPPHLHIAGGSIEEALARLKDNISVVYLWDMESGATREDAHHIWYERPDSQVPGGGGAVNFARVLELAVQYCPEAHWVLCYHGTEEWEHERIQQSISRSLRFVEKHRPT
jgi:predicted dehydrogenase/sugar phosphate isomerase/epimerase